MSYGHFEKRLAAHNFAKFTNYEYFFAQFHEFFGEMSGRSLEGFKAVATELFVEFQNIRLDFKNSSK
jgi:hypothetical protein